MKIELEQVSPHEIEKRSFEIITEELNGRTFPEDQELVVKRCIHTSADLIMRIISAFRSMRWQKASRRSGREPAL